MKRLIQSIALITLFALAIFAVPNQVSAQTSLDEIVEPGEQAVVLGTGYGFSEGPACDAEGNIYFSDGKKDTIHYYAIGGEVEVFVDDSLDANGMMFNQQGELISVEGAAYHIVAFNVETKEKRVIVSEIDGTHFNEPNDLTIDATGGFYFTDPNYRHRGQETVMKEDVYYVAACGTPTRVSTVCVKPNGILLTPDNKILYLADNRERKIYRYDVEGPGKITNETLWIPDLGAGPDGMTLDDAGNLYIACGRAGVKIYSPDADLIGVLDGEYGVPYSSNVCFGGPNFDTLYITASDQFLGLATRTTGLPALCVEE
jgi:gluconolactonase